MSCENDLSMTVMLKSCCGVWRFVCDRRWRVVAPLALLVLQLRAPRDGAFRSNPCVFLLNDLRGSIFYKIVRWPAVPAETVEHEPSDIIFENFHVLSGPHPIGFLQSEEEIDG